MKRGFCRVSMMLLMMLLSSATAWADSTFGGGDGTAKNPYIISTADHWNQLSTDVAAGTTYNGKYFQMVDDIDVGNKMVGCPDSNGKSYHTFNGIFDGNGHTLTVALSSNGDWCAPFAFTYGATIKNLATAGTISTKGRYAGGVVGRNGTANLTLTNVKSSVEISSSYNGEAIHGGLVGYTINATLTGCAFDGKLSGSSSKKCGGLVGWKTSTSGSSITLNNCVFAPTQVTISSTGSHPFVVNNGNATFNNCYYLSNAFGTSQGKQARSITISNLFTIVPTGNATEFNTSGITAYQGNPCLKYDGVVYAGSGDVVTLTFIHNRGYNMNYKVGDAYLPGNDNDGYTLTMPNNNVEIIAEMTGTPLAQLSGSGKESEPYEIPNTEAWDIVVSQVNNGSKAYAKAYYRLDADITVTTMVGTGAYPFKGHFDGNSHKLTVNYGTESAPFNEEYCAPFRYVKAAYIHDLHVAGTIYTQKKFAAGIIAHSSLADIDDLGLDTQTKIENCRVSVTINSTVNGDGTHAGFVSNNTAGELSIEGCVFDGSLLGSNSSNCAGFVGWNETANSSGRVYISNSLFAPKRTEMVLEKTFARSRNYWSTVFGLTNCYCANYDNNQGERVYSVTTDTDDITMTYNGGDATKSYTVSGLSFYATGLTFNNALYAEKAKQLNLTLSGANQGETYYTTTGELSLNTDNNTYTLTTSNDDAIIYVDRIETWGGTGTGEDGDHPYIIDCTDRWIEFVNKVNSGQGNFPTAYYKLTENIEVTTMVGTERHPFKGHFNGNSHKLTVSYGSQDSPFYDEYCAPFRYVKGADIQYLNVYGTIYTQKKFAAGIVGKAVGNNNIAHCRSYVTINSSVDGDGTHGGLVANIGGGSTTITDCAFFGSLLGSATDRCGGLVGWTDGSSATISNCLFAPARVTVNANGSATFSRGNEPQISGCYFTYSLGTVQGTLVYADMPASTLYTTLNLFGQPYYLPVKSPISDVSASDITANSAIISWVGSEGCSDYQVRYRKCNAYFNGFEDGLASDWTTIDADGDGHNWYVYNFQEYAHSGNRGVASDSYVANNALTPDNWLISPQLTLGGTLRVWLRGEREDYYQEHFAIYVSTTETNPGENLESFVTLVPDQVTTLSYKEYTADLSSYAGQQGYIAIRHYNCHDVYTLLLDDFELFVPVEGGAWTTVGSANAEGTIIDNLEPNTTYEYQIVYKNQGATYYSPSSILTTRNDLVVPADLIADNVTQNTATIGWTGYAEKYNLRYTKYASTSEIAQVTLCVPEDVWEDGTGYQMLLDKNHTTFGTVIPEEGALTTSDNNSSVEELYANFEYKIPNNADGDLNTSNFVSRNSVTISIPAGMYDWCITNPTPGDRVWIASGNGNVGGRQNDFVFEPGKHYTFTVSLGGFNDCVDMSVSDIEGSTNREWTTVNNIEVTSYTMSGLTPGSLYQVQVQSVKGNEQSEWSDVYFTTANGTDVSVKFAPEGFATYYDGQHDLELPEDMKAYVVTGTGGSNDEDGYTVTYTQIAGVGAETNTNVVPAKTAVLLQMPKADKAFYSTIGLTTASGSSYSGVNLLHGSDDGVTADQMSSISSGKHYLLAYGKGEHSGVFGWYYGAEDGGAFASGAHKAWLTIPAGGSQARFLALPGYDGHATGIVNSEWLMVDGEWFTLDGRRLSGKPTKKGVYIHAGRKVVVK